MILYNIVIGNQNVASNPWSHIIDNHGNHFIAKDDIHQRIRIDNRVDETTYPAVGELKPTWSAVNTQRYELLAGTRWANNNRNMNPLLLSSKEFKDGNEQVVVYLTVSNNYIIGQFNTSHKILQTYHKKDVLQGCAIVLSTNDRENDNRIISLSVYDKNKDQYCQFNIIFMKEDINKIKVIRKPVVNTEVLNKMKEQVRKYKNRYMGFKILTKPEELMTSTYVTSDKFKQDVINATKKINKPKIITINPDQLTTEEGRENIIAMLQDEFNADRVRAITQCGVSLPLDIIRDLKLLYVFNFDLKNNVLSCKKSN
jgi:hypothetical protein